MALISLYYTDHTHTRLTLKRKLRGLLKPSETQLSSPPSLNLHLYLTPLREDRSSLRVAVGGVSLSTRGLGLLSLETGWRKLRNAREQQRLRPCLPPRLNYMLQGTEIAQERVHVASRLPAAVLAPADLGVNSALRVDRASSALFFPPRLLPLCAVSFQTKLEKKEKKKKKRSENALRLFDLLECSSSPWLLLWSPTVGAPTPEKRM